MRQNIPNMLLIAGTGRKSGKTTLACACIAHFSKQTGIYAIKISPHTHDDEGLTTEIARETNYRLYE